MTAFSFGSIAAAMKGALHEDAPAILHGGTTTKWGEFDARTDALAAAFTEAGAVPGDKAAHLMRNSPAYLETTWAAFKSRLVHVNVNYRYTGEELFYILDNSDSAVLVYDEEFAPVIAELHPRLTKIKLFLQVGREPADFAESYEELAGTRKVFQRDDHRPDDMLFIYTGGTTGYPKGVMWDQGDLWQLLGGGASMPGDPPCADLPALLAKIERHHADPETARRSLILPPLMHGSGYLIAIYTLATGGSVVLCESPSFDPCRGAVHYRELPPQLGSNRRGRVRAAAAAGARRRRRRPFRRSGS